MRAGLAVSTHPVAAIATGEAAGQLLEKGFDAADLVCCFVTSGHAGALEDIARALRTLLSPTTLLGAACAAVLGHTTVVERGPGLVLWAANVGPTSAVRLSPDGAGEVPPDASGLILLVDPASASCGHQWQPLQGTRHDLAISGTLVTPARAAGGSLLMLNGQLQRVGAVGVALAAGAGFAATVSPGRRPIGPEMVVTSAEGPMIYELDHAVARHRVERLARHELPATDIAFINDGLLLRVRDGGEERTYPVAGADTANGAIAVGPYARAGDLIDGSSDIHPGAVVRFEVHDRAVETTELRRILAQPQLDAALVFPSTPRRSSARAAALGTDGGSAAIAGCQGAAAIGWLGGIRAAHHRAAAVACFY